MRSVAPRFALRVPAPAETEDAAVPEAVAQRIDDYKIADQTKRAGVHDFSFDN